MTQDLDHVVVIAGSGVPEHMIGRLREHGMIVVSAPDGMSMSDNALRIGIDLGARPSETAFARHYFDADGKPVVERIDPAEFYVHPADRGPPYEHADDALRYMMGGIRAGKTAAIRDRMAAHAEFYDPARIGATMPGPDDDRTPKRPSKRQRRRLRGTR